MIRASLVVLALLAAACSPQSEQAEALQSCDTLELSSGALTPGECQIDAGGQIFRITYAPLAAGATGGTVGVEVMGPDGDVVQSLLESEVSEYRPVSIEDIDGDGRLDVRIPIATGNANTQSALWIYSGERGSFQRVGDVSGISIERTADGYLAVPGRSSAVAWEVPFYHLDEGGLHPLVTVTVEAPEGRSTEPSCRVTDAPGLGRLNMSEQQAAEKFCAEPATRVFE